jgi:predicted metal-dependent hydrolase
LKLLPDEEEIQKVFNAIKKVKPEVKVPLIHEVDLDGSTKRYGSCLYKGGISISMTNIPDRTINNFKFIETVCHEVVHYNHYEYGHSELFWEILNDLKEKVRKELCH